jgi:hypothetical protein
MTPAATQADRTAEARQAVLDDVRELAPSKLAHFEKAFRGGSLRAAITANCLYCTQYDVAAIRECTSYGCPLRNCRPYQKPTEKAGRGFSQAGGDHAESDNS